MSRSSGQGVDHEPATELELAVELLGPPPRVPGEDPYRFEVAPHVGGGATQVDGADPPEQWLPRVRVLDPAHPGEADDRFVLLHRTAHEGDRGRRGDVGPVGQRLTDPERIGRLVEHEPDGTIVGVLDHEHHRAEEVGVVERRHRHEQRRRAQSAASCDGRSDPDRSHRHDAGGAELGAGARCRDRVRSSSTGTSRASSGSPAGRSRARRTRVFEENRSGSAGHRGGAARTRGQSVVGLHGPDTLDPPVRSWGDRLGERRAEHGW